ncbi:MAG: [protein-PII] uridylyltransferase [Xanthomonadaceae bacterium]|jgi:[protein-PII] uridylyltransferase|nr:[protein-PII] uridylyltransferase [Xanthomonadaceae bacterium]
MTRLPAPADAERWWPAGRAETLQAPRGVREAVERADAALAQALTDGESIERVVALRAWVIEQAVLVVWQRVVGAAPGVALVAVGGFGRGELHPRSDVDLLALVAPRRDPALSTALERFFAALWDEGLAVGHAVRTAAECEDAARGDLTVMTNLLENRLIAGAHDLHADLQAAIDPRRVWPADAFAAGKRAEQQARHARYHDTAYNLEPNLKDGPGGLRDLQTVVWIARRQLGLASIEALRDAGLLSAEEYGALARSRATLWRIRFALHHLARRGEERLVFEHQRELARLFGLRDEHPQNLAVEQFMQGYYRAAMTVGRLNERLLQRLDELREAPPGGAPAEPIDDEFAAVGAFLDLRDPHRFERQPAATLRAFRVLLDRPDLQGLRSTLLARLDAVLPTLADALRADPEANAAFLAIIRHPGAVAHILQRMSRYGVLGAFLPAFGKVAGRMQYDLFHVYTVDQHTLFVIRNVRQYADPAAAGALPLPCEVYSRLRRPELLLLAALFHDIAKGRGGDHSELGEADARAFCERIGLSSADADLVGWLVRQHLTMSVTAQKQDITDPRVVHRFAGIVTDIERLDHLYLLTVADIRATSPKLWNSWKDRLLAELYQSAHYVLARGLEHPVNASQRIAEARVAALVALGPARLDVQRIEALWAEFPPDSFLRYSPDQIAWQTRAIVAAGTMPVVAVRRSPERGTTELFVYSADKDGLFATIAAVIDRMQLNVVEARIVTSAAGHTLDTFQLLEEDGTPVADAARENQLVARLRDELSHDVLSLKPARRAASRRQKQFHVPLRTEFDFAPSGRTQLALVCSDRPGLLAHVSAALRECNLRVHDARIATFGERVEDFFELTDQHDRALNATQLDALREALRRHIDNASGTDARHDLQPA